MNLWAYLFNIDEQEARVEDSSIVKKYAFSATLAEKLILEPGKFIPSSCKNALIRLNNTWNFSKMDLLFFPIVRDNHWVLVCINMFLKQVSWFNSINASTRTRCYGCAKNLVTNFSKEAIEADVFKEDVSQFEWIFPKDLDAKN